MDSRLPPIAACLALAAAVLALAPSASADGVVLPISVDGVIPPGPVDGVSACATRGQVCVSVGDGGFCGEEVYNVAGQSAGANCFNPASSDYGTGCFAHVDGIYVACWDVGDSQCLVGVGPTAYTMLYAVCDP